MLSDDNSAKAHSCRTTVTVRDFLEFQQFIVKRVQNDATGFLKNWKNFAIFFLLVIIMFVIIVFGERWGLHVYSVLAGGVGFAVLAIILAAYFQRRMARISLPREGGVTLGEKTVTADEAHLRQHSALGSTEFVWDAVLDVLETKNLYIIQLDTLLGLIMPRRDVDASEDGYAIVELARRKVAERRRQAQP